MTDRWKKTKGLSIFLRLFLSFLAASLLIIAIVMTVYFLSARQRIRQYVNDEIVNSVQEAAAYFNSGYNAAISSDLILLESVPSFNNFLTAPGYEKSLVRFDIEKLFYKLSLARGKLYRAIVFYDAYGMERVAVRGQRRVRKFSSVFDHSPESLPSQKTRRLFERLKTAKQGAILTEDLFDDQEGRPLILVGISKREPEIAGFGGAILLTCDLSEFISHLANMKIFDTNGAWLIAGSDRVLLSPPEWEEPHLPDSIFIPTEAPSPDRTRGLPVRGVFSHSAPCILGSEQQEIARIAFSLAPHTYTGLLKMALLKGLWLLVFIVAFIFVVALLLARHFSKPISELVRASQRLSKGDFQASVDITSAGEIGVLARSFNEMAAALHRTIGDRDLEIENRRQSEQSLREKEEEIRLLLDSTAEAIYGIDKKGICTFCNPATLKILGYEKEEEILGRHMHTLIHHTGKDGNRNPENDCKIYRSLQQREGTHADDEIFWRADGSNFWVEYWSYPVIKGGDIVGAVVTFIDISERRIAQAERERLANQLQQAQKMEAIGTLAGGIAHDFNNILAALMGFAEIARDGVPPESAVRADMDEVLHAANRAKELVKQILAFSRQGEDERQPLRIDMVVKEALKLLRATIPTTIEIREDIDAGDCHVLADPTRIHQIVMNLCTNAYQAMRDEGGVLAVELGQREIGTEDDKVGDLHLAPGPYMVLKVSDTGQGMNRAILERIFEPYFTTKPKGEGTGMGLAVTHGIVKGYGGHITVYSEAGQGTTFQVYLPRFVAPSAGLKSPAESHVPRGNERLMVIDDEKNVVQVEKRMLEFLGYRVTAMVDGREALQAFTARPADYDLIITDMTMPHADGAELARRFMAVRPDIPVIMCTGFSEVMNEDKAKAIGIREFILKPIVRDDLARVVRKVLDGGSY